MRETQTCPPLAEGPGGDHHRVINVTASTNTRMPGNQTRSNDHIPNPNNNLNTNETGFLSASRFWTTSFKDNSPPRTAPTIAQTPSAAAIRDGDSGIAIAPRLKPRNTNTATATGVAIAPPKIFSQTDMPASNAMQFLSIKAL